MKSQDPIELITLHPLAQLGFVPDEPMEFYHESRAIGHSSVHDFITRGPAFWFHKYMARLPNNESSDSLDFGSAFHAAILEPQRFEKDYVIAPDGMKFNTKDGRIWKKEKEEQGQHIIRGQDAMRINLMKRGLYENEDAKMLLESADLREITLRMQIGKLPLQCRFDAWMHPSRKVELPMGWQHDGAISIDIKTCSRLFGDGPGTWARNFHIFGYHRNAAFYSMMAREFLGKTDAYYRSPIGTVPHVFIVCEREAPYECAVFVPNAEAIAIGQNEVGHALNQITNCLMLNEWRSASTGVTEIGLPNWYQDYVPNEISQY